MCHFHPYSQSVPPFKGCTIAQERLQAQGTTVLADSVSSDVNGILLMFSATLGGCTGSALNSGLDSPELAGRKEKPLKHGFLVLLPCDKRFIPSQGCWVRFGTRVSCVSSWYNFRHEKLVNQMYCSYKNTRNHLRAQCDRKHFTET